MIEITVRDALTLLTFTAAHPRAVVVSKSGTWHWHATCAARLPDLPYFLQVMASLRLLSEPTYLYGKRKCDQCFQLLSDPPCTQPKSTTG